MELLLRRQARLSLNQFIRATIGLEPARHHRYINDKLEAVLRGDIKRLMLFMPPGSAKSTYASIGFPAFALGRYPTRSILASSHTTELAERFGRRVRNLISSTEYARVFQTRISHDSHAAGRWATSSGGEYYAAGVGSAIAGFRADIGIIDDPIAGREQADSERDREKIWAWYKDDFWPRLKPDAAVLLIMQRWHEDDLAGRILKDDSEGGEHWDIVSIPMEATEGDVLGREPGSMLWPEWFKPEMVEQAKRDPRTWLALYQQRPRPETGGEFKKAWLCHYKTPPPLTRLNTVILVDPASQKKASSDYTAMVVVGLGHDANYYVLEIVRERLNLTERADRLFSLHRQYKPLRVGYEKYSMQADVEHIKDRQEREHYRFPIIELGGQLKKEDRIRRLIPLFENRRIYLPEAIHRVNDIGVLRDLIRDFIEEEYAPFPVGKYDDILDCMARLEDKDLAVIFPTEIKERPRMPMGPGGSQAWMS